MISEPETLSQDDHIELSRMLCYLTIGLNGVTNRYTRKYLLHGSDSQPPPRESCKAHGDAVTGVCALRAGLEHHCLGQRLIPSYYDHVKDIAPSLEPDFNPGDQHVADLVPVAQMVRRRLEGKAQCECVLKVAVGLETALRGVWRAVEGGRY
jgi:hypothetical protein